MFCPFAHSLVNNLFGMIYIPELMNVTKTNQIHTKNFHFKKTFHIEREMTKIINIKKNITLKTIEK